MERFKQLAWDDIPELDMDAVNELLSDMADDEDLVIWTDTYDIYLPQEAQDG